MFRPPPSAGREWFLIHTRFLDEIARSLFYSARGALQGRQEETMHDAAVASDAASTARRTSIWHAPQACRALVAADEGICFARLAWQGALVSGPGLLHLRKVRD